MSNEVGRPTELDNELMLKIRDLVQEGKTIKEMSEILDIPYATMRYWSATNYQSFADKLLAYKHERMLRKAETNIEVIMDNEDPRLMLDASKFVAETIGKKNYSKQVNNDITSGGKALILPATLIEKNDTNSQSGNNSTG